MGMTRTKWVRAMLKRQGIYDTVNAPGAAATAPVQSVTPQVRK